MKTRIKKNINKNLKMFLIIGLVVVVAMGALLMLISGNADDRDQVAVDPTETEQQDKKKKDRKIAEIGDHPGVSDVALAMYNARVDDITDTAQVAQLLEASDMREELGDYLATLKVKGDNKILIITFEKQLKEGEDTAFDEKATWYAEQFLALIADAGEVRWTYDMEVIETTEDSDKSDKESDKKDSEKEETTEAKEPEYKSLTLEQANELLKVDDIKSYSETPELVQTLLNNQKGIV